MEKIVLDTAKWTAATVVAILAVAANQDWNHAHGRIVGAGMCLAVLPAALATFPTYTSPKTTVTVRAGV
jgi:hypothetical protein